MLVLSRKTEERILIGDSIRITVLHMERNQVRIGIEAPKDVTIIREELLGAAPASTPSLKSSERVRTRLGRSGQPAGA